MNDIHILFDFSKKTFSIDAIELKLAYKSSQKIVQEFVKELNTLRNKRMFIHPHILLIFITSSFLFGSLSLVYDIFIYFAYISMIASIGFALLFYVEFSKFRNLVEGVCQSFSLKLQGFYNIKNNMNLTNGFTLNSYQVSLERIENQTEIAVDELGNQSDFIVSVDPPTRSDMHSRNESFMESKFANLQQNTINNSPNGNGNFEQSVMSRGI